MTGRIVEKEIQEYRYGVLSDGNESILFDTVPAEFAQEWLDSAPGAKTLVLCGDNPYPKSVKCFLDARPDGVVHASAYTLYVLNGILGEDPRLCKASDHTVIHAGKLQVGLNVVTQPGKAAYLIADAGEVGIYSGAPELPFGAPVVYDRPTVAIAYVSGCDYTEKTAERIAEGIRDSEDLDVLLIDLASTKVPDAVSAMVNASGILIGTPTVDGDASKKVWELLTAMPVKLFAGKPAAAFGYYTRGGEGMLHVIERMKQLRMNLLDNGFNVQYRPGDGEMKSIYEYGYAYGCTLQNKPNTHRSTLVKCLVCGDVFDAALGVCPVCGVGMDKCVPVDDEAIGFSGDSDRSYVIVGGGTAALSAADAIRKRDKTGRITMISAEPCLPINRTMLSKNMVLAAKCPEGLAVKEQSWFEENQIDIRLSTLVTEVNPEKKYVCLSDNTALSYDKLIWAAGAECFVPDIPGKDLRGVLTVRHLKDVFDIWNRLPNAKHAVVIGGGVLGLEVAAELKKMRLGVTVLEMAPRIMSRQLDDETGDRLMAAAESYGIQILTGVNITDILGEETVSGVRIEDGTIFPADIVVMSCGNKATVDAVLDAGAECARAVKVNARMETTLPDVYACGDCAEINGANFQLWAEATEQGRIAGANAAGDRVKYDAISYGASFEGMNTRLFAIGDVGKGGKDYKLVEIRNEVEDSYRKYWFHENRLCGGILYGDTNNVQILTDAFIAESPYFGIKDKL